MTCWFLANFGLLLYDRWRLLLKQFIR